MDQSYQPEEIEAEAQRYWEEHRSFKVTEDPSREKFYCLSMFPYPSGRLHMGHVRNYTIGDVIARYQRMLGKNVLQPMGWDAFGLPAENAAIQKNVPPARWTYENIDYMKGQLKRLGFGYDWDRELATCRPDYYRWEQWLFTRLARKGLAYKRNATVNWDPVDQTVLANEQVVDGKGWRSGAVVERREIPQWFLKITDYAEELLDGLDSLEGWPEAVRTMQRNWIGRSQGVELSFDIQGGGQLSVYTTRPDTLMGVSYMAVAAGHPLAQRAAGGDTRLNDFLEECRHSTVSEADMETMEKQGMPLGVDAIHPISGEPIPVWVANFVLMGYGTGAVMAVPGHDQRDWEFARKYDLPIKQVITSYEREIDLHQGAFADQGTLINSGPFNGLSSRQAFEAIADQLESQGRGRRRVNYRLRDWGVSRQRYWGAPIPMINCADGRQVPVPEDQLPVVLPEDVAFQGVVSPIKQMAQFKETTCPGSGEPAERETDTFDTFMESSWYYARFTCPGSDGAMLDQRANYWLPVDQYVGGVEHAVLHLLYARFYHKLLRDEGLVDSDEPFTRLLTQGMVVAETYYRQQDGRRVYFNPQEVTVQRDDKGRVVQAVLKADGRPVTVGDIEKMSKSKNNGVDPEELIRRFGADTVRLFMMFAAPPDQSLEWSDAGVEGASRFLRRLWNWCTDNAPAIRAAGQVDWNGVAEPLADVRHQVHGELKAAQDYYERQQFNTVVSCAMKILNALSRLEEQGLEADALRREGADILLRLLAPVVPHVAHGLYHRLAFAEAVLDTPFPSPDPRALERATVPM
ncbi:MAG: leucine--tRNA ligase, partial [Candidatus Competibacteraceae bacterium]|nr:leucine--tRNA ligase [Candidatus Competibacteraceae bacterium]